jgi:hypothetical protein
LFTFLRNNVIMCINFCNSDEVRQNPWNLVYTFQVIHHSASFKTDLIKVHGILIHFREQKQARKFPILQNTKIKATKRKRMQEVQDSVIRNYENVLIIHNSDPIAHEGWYKRPQGRPIYNCSNLYKNSHKRSHN